MRKRRKIIRIDEEKCDGCGRCVIACAEGAIQIVDGKARLVSEVYCDGLGACIGECPRGALTIEEREAEEFDEEAVKAHLASIKKSELSCGCPGSALRSIKRESGVVEGPTDEIESALTNWPVQIHLVPPGAPYLNGAHLLVAADCVPPSYGEFHRKMLAGKVLLLGCPKLHDAEFYRLKLTQILKENDVEAIDVAYMEVPCCAALTHAVRKAVSDSGKKIPINMRKVTIDGRIAENSGGG